MKIKMYFKILKYWAFYRILGLRDIGKFIQVQKDKANKKSKRDRHLNGATVSVCNDTQVDSGVEAFDGGNAIASRSVDGHSETCPTWFSTRIFKGTEQYPSDKRSWTPEFIARAMLANCDIVYKNDELRSVY